MRTDFVPAAMGRRFCGDGWACAQICVPVQFRYAMIIVVLTAYKTRTTCTPTYLSNLIHDYIQTRTLRSSRDGFEDTMFEAKAKAKARQRRGQGQGQTTSRPRPRPNYLEAASRPKPNLFYLKNYWCKIVHCMRVEQQQMARYIVI